MSRSGASSSLFSPFLVTTSGVVSPPIGAETASLLHRARPLPRTLSRRGTWGPSRGRCGRSRRPSYEPFVTSLSLQLHVRDADLRERLAVAGVAAVTRAAGEAVDPDLRALAVPHHFDRHLGALHDRLARVHLLAVAREQHAVEGHLGPRLGVELGELERDPRLGPELTAADRKNGIGHGPRTLTGTCGSVKTRETAKGQRVPFPVSRFPPHATAY